MNAPAPGSTPSEFKSAALYSGVAVLCAVMAVAGGLSLLLARENPVFLALCGVSVIIAAVSGWVLIVEIAGGWTVMALLVNLIVFAAAMTAVVLSGVAAANDVHRSALRSYPMVQRTIDQAQARQRAAWLAHRRYISVSSPLIKQLQQDGWSVTQKLSERGDTWELDIRRPSAWVITAAKAGRAQTTCIGEVTDGWVCDAFGLHAPAAS